MKKQKKEKVITVADVGFDMAADAGAAVGSFFAPPLGTVVGADSIMDMGHKAIDKVCDCILGED